MSVARRSIATTDAAGRRNPVDVLIVGAGIGGLAAALAFARRGASVRVVERAPEIAEVGAGLQVTPNGGRVLRALGLQGAVLARGIRAQAVEPHDALTGRRIARFDLAEAGDWIFLHRSDLQAILLDAATAAGAAIRTGATVSGVTSDGVLLEDGERLTADLVVGADGIRSVIRRHVVGPAEPFFTGQVAWRALVDSAPQEPVARIWMGPGRHAVTYPLRDGRLNLVAVREEAAWSEEGWSHRGTPDSLREAFPDSAPELAAILSRVVEVGRWGLFRHPVPESWHRGRVVLLGDAAHPTLPFLAQGANLALEDAWVLAREVTEHGPDEGIERYGFDRRPRVSDAIEAANANARNYHLTGATRFIAHLGLGAIGAVAPGAFLRRLDWLYGFDVTADG